MLRQLICEYPIFDYQNLLMILIIFVVNLVFREQKIYVISLIDRGLAPASLCVINVRAALQIIMPSDRTQSVHTRAKLYR